MRIALCGAGAMGGALLRGWLSAGHPPDSILVVEPDAQRADHLAHELGISIADYAEAASADVIVLAVKPHVVEDVLERLSRGLRPGSIVVSIAAGVPLQRIERVLPEGVAAVRVMPNTAALVGAGMAGISPGAAATQDDTDRVRGLMDAVGSSVVVAEKHLDALTALSGSGPAYLFYIAEAMIEAGVHEGLTREEATQLVNQTFAGAAAMLTGAGRSAAELREMVTSPAGTTAAALRHLDERGVRAAFLGAVEACVRRSQQI